MDATATAMSVTDDQKRDRIARLFRFVAALHEQRNPAVRRINEHPWLLRLVDIPDFPSLTLTLPDADEGDKDDVTEGEPVLLRCRRPSRTEPPHSPDTLKGWLGREWSDPQAAPSPLPSRNIPGIEGPVRFEDDEEREVALEEYRSLWSLWAHNERTAIAAGEIFERIYELHAMLQRDGERYELVVADGMLIWGRPEGGVRHPLLSRVVRLEFAPEIPEFRIVETGAVTEFYTNLFRSMEEVDGQSMGRLRSEAESLDPHPLGTHETIGFLRSVVMSLSSRGSFVEGILPPERDYPVVGRAPCFLLRRRTSGVARAIESVINDSLVADNFPKSILNVVGTPEEEPASSTTALASTLEANAVISDANADEHVLFTKPANPEQLDIARCLERDDCVLVQGPPGTGKTHTIANLLGHLLAAGKSVLVASHTTKALKVLREKVVPQLQPLCVSVLDSTDDDTALKSSIEGIVERIGSADLGRLDREVERFTAERATLVSEVRSLQTAVIDARSDEHRPIVFGGEETTPIAAAKEAAKGLGVNDWVPSPLALGEALPLTIGELGELYTTNASVSPGDEQMLSVPLPDLSECPLPSAFERLTAERRDIEAFDRGHKTEWWLTSGGNDVECLDEALDTARQALEASRHLPEWAHHLLRAGADEAERRAWDILLAEVEATREFALSSQELLLTHDPRLAPELPTERSAEVYASLSEEVHRIGKAPSFLSLITHREWKIAIEGARVGAARRPCLPEHFAALTAMATLQARREALRRRWTLQVEAIGGPSGASLGNEVEAACRQLTPLISAALDWFSRSWSPALAQLSAAALRWENVQRDADVRFPGAHAVDRIALIVDEELPPAFAAERARRRWRELESTFAALRKICEQWARSAAADNLKNAVINLLPAEYRAAHEEITRLRHVAEQARRRRELLGRLEKSAPGWAAAIKNRFGRHGEASVPGDPNTAWRWRQFEDELARRHAVSLPDLLTKLEERREHLRETTAELVDRKAWRAQVARTTLEQRQALVGFAGAKRRIGRGTGKRAATFARVARELMTKARSSVPVWIMPIVKAAEVFDPRTSRFDVVIIDEASQSDITGLLAFYLGRQIVVVGDDEQVSPSAVGEKALDTQHLIDEFLQGIPNAQLYDGKQSLYDIAKASFGGTICLLEHFRCVPDIIRFSNAVSYQGRIKPLREARPLDPKPAVVAHRVASSGAGGKVNEDEARTVASLIGAVVEQPEYTGKSIGVISLIGEDQAYRIGTILRGILPPTEIEDRRLLAGSAAQFQGDERNVMFLSMVDAGIGLPLPLRQDRMFQQRFNVAASRAQDQMWVVYSLDPTRELKADDLRRKLIEHALDPAALGRNEAAALARAESPFEAEVIQRLSAAGFRVKTQHWVGAYRIDIVVEGEGGRRLAVECDGDRFHRIEDLEADAQRQAILERVGWTFARIRGSSFYRERDAAMAPVFERLHLMGIEPLGTLSSSTTSAEDGELLHRIRSRATEILADIQGREEQGALFAPKMGGRGSRAKRVESPNHFQ